MKQNVYSLWPVIGRQTLQSALAVSLLLSQPSTAQTPHPTSETWLDKPQYGSRAEPFMILPLTAWQPGVPKNKKTLWRIMTVSGFGCESILFCPESSNGTLVYE